MNLRYYFGFTKSQYKGLLLLLILNFGIILFYFVDDYLYQTSEPHDFSELIAHLDSLDFSNQKTSVDSLYAFNPNTLSADGFVNFGLNISLANRIDKYRKSGGYFYAKENLLKIYGMDSSWFFKVEPFIVIEARDEVEVVAVTPIKPFPFNPNTVSVSSLLKMGLNETTANAWVKYLSKGGNFKTCNDLEKLYHLSDEEFKALLPFCELEKVQEEPVERVDINSADSILLLKVKGIGPAYSHRVIEYRNLLGGFVSLNQLMEIYGIDSLKFNGLEPQIKIDEVTINERSVNSDDFKVLLRHPYLTYEQVKSIVNYRRDLGVLNSLSELLELEGFSVQDTARLKPYLSFKIN